MTNTILGLSGYARAGKDTFADILVREHGWKRVAFADKLKRLAEELNPEFLWSGGQVKLTTLLRIMGWEEVKMTVPESRVYLQTLGVAVRDILGPDTWVRAAWQDVVESEAPVVITDVRFANEIAHIRANGGVLARIDRPGVEPANSHISEHEWQQADFEWIIDNDGTIEDLEEIADLLVWQLSK